MTSRILLASRPSSMANCIDANVFFVYPLTTLSIDFTKTSGKIPLTLLEKQGNASNASHSLSQILIMLLSIFCNSFSRTSSSALEGTINRKFPLNY